MKKLDGLVKLTPQPVAGPVPELDTVKTRGTERFPRITVPSDAEDGERVSVGLPAGVGVGLTEPLGVRVGVGVEEPPAVINAVFT